MSITHITCVEFRNRIPHNANVRGYLSAALEGDYRPVPVAFWCVDKQAEVLYTNTLYIVKKKLFILFHFRRTQFWGK